MLFSNHIVLAGRLQFYIQFCCPCSGTMLYPNINPNIPIYSFFPCCFINIFMESSAVFRLYFTQMKTQCAELLFWFMWLHFLLLAWFILTVEISLNSWELLPSFLGLLSSKQLPLLIFFLSSVYTCYAWLLLLVHPCRYFVLFWI